MPQHNNIYRDLIMRKSTSPIRDVKVVSRSKTSENKNINHIQQSSVDKNQPTFVYTENFKCWQHPWTLQFMYKQYFLGLPKPKSQKKTQHLAQVTNELAQVFAEATVGIQHRQSNIQLPCQDAAKATLKPRPILIVCDGAGSAAVSDIGSQALVTQLTRLCQSLEPLIAPYLDLKDNQDIHPLVRVLVRHAIGILEDCANIHRRSIRDFRSTLNFALIGTEHILWLKIGDGEIVHEQIMLNKDSLPQTQYQCLGEPHKGEFANQTQFIDDQLKLNDVHWGMLPSKTTTGLVLMSDGASEKLVSHDRKNVAGQISTWLEQLRQNQFKVAEFYQRIYAEDFLKRSTGDDRSIALYSKMYHLAEPL